MNKSMYVVLAVVASVFSVSSFAANLDTTSKDVDAAKVQKKEIVKHEKKSTKELQKEHKVKIDHKKVKEEKKEDLNKK